MFVCLSVRLFTFEVPFKRLFAPTSQSWMSNFVQIFGILAGKSNGSLFFGPLFQGLVGYTTRIRRLYNKDQEVMFSDAIIDPLQKTFPYKGCKITTRKKKFLFLQILPHQQKFLVSVLPSALHPQSQVFSYLGDILWCPNLKRF